MGKGAPEILTEFYEKKKDFEDILFMKFSQDF